jgi:hypothetical protein
MTSSEKPLPFDEFPLFIPTKALSLLNPIHRTKILEIIPRGRKYQDDIKRPEQKNLQVLRILL